MKRMIAFSVLSMVLVCAAVGQMSDKKTKAKTSGNGNIEQTLMQMERDWTDAVLKKDTAALGRILADDWVGQGPTGTTSQGASTERARVR